MGEKLFEKKAAGNTADYMLRTVQQNNMVLSAVADRKANILIGVSFIMMTLMLGHVDAYGFSAPIAVLGSFTLVAVLFAILAVVPSRATVSGTSTDNPLFFGSIAAHDEELYARKLSRIVETEDRVVRAISHDLWQHSVVLSRQKYHYLRISYVLFLLGWAATAVTVGITSLSG